MGSRHEPHRVRHQHDLAPVRVAHAARRERRVEPSLAESWEYSDDGTSITFTLREGLTFSDGEPVDAEAVKAFFERGKAQEDSHLKDQLADLESVTADSELDVTLHLSEVDYQIPYLVAGRTGAIASPKAGEDPAQLAIEPVGAGPFILTEFVAESHATFEKNPDYWDAENIHIDKLTLKPRLDAATVVAAIQSGSVDVAVIPATQVEAAESAGIDVTVETALTASDASINLNKAPFDDPQVVEAFRYVFDRQAFVDAVTAGLGTVTHQPFPEGYLAFNPDIEDLWDYDPAKAKQLLADAGYAEGDLSVGITAQAGAEVAAELAQAQLAAVGVSSTIQVVPAGSTTWQDEVYVAKSPQLALDGTIGRESPVANLLATYGPQGIMNLSGPHAIGRVPRGARRRARHAHRLAGLPAGAVGRRRGRRDAVADELPLQLAVDLREERQGRRAQPPALPGALGRRGDRRLTSDDHVRHRRRPARSRAPRAGGRGAPLRRAGAGLGRTALIIVPVFFLATIITFALGAASGLSPAASLSGDEATPERIAAINAELGLDQPVVVQYLTWIGHVLSGDLGSSWYNGFPVAGPHRRAARDHRIHRRTRPPPRASSSGSASVCSRPSSAGAPIDRAITGFTTLISTLPPFVVSIGLIIVLSVWLRLLPSSGYVPFEQDPVLWFKLILMPAIALSFDPAADLARQLRTGLVHVLEENYIVGAACAGSRPAASSGCTPCATAPAPPSPSSG